MIEKYKPSHLEKPSVQGQTRQLAIPSIVEEYNVAGAEDLIAASFFPSIDRLRNRNHIFVSLLLLLLTWLLLLASLIFVLFENFIDDVRFFIHRSDFFLFLKQKIISILQCILSTALELLLDD